MTDWLIEARDNATLARLGVVEDYQQATIVPRFNTPGAWTLDLHVDSQAAAFFDFDAGIVVSLDGTDGTEFFSGPVVGRERTRDESGDDRLRITGVDDSVWLARRLCFPEAPALTTATDAYDVRTGIASTVMAAYVDNNAGPSADAGRRVSGLVLGTDHGYGSTVTGRGRFQTLQDLLNTLALAGGDLGYQIVQMGANLVFAVYQPTDRSASVRFDDALGNLRAFTYSQAAPSNGGNFVVVGSAGDDTARVFVTGGDPASISAYGRIEAFVDQSNTTDTTELEQARDTALAQTAAPVSSNITPEDTEAIAFGDSYGLGDKVALIVDGVEFANVVREVNIQLSADGALVLPSVGTPNQDSNYVIQDGQSVPVPALFERLRTLETQVANLQTRR